MSKRIVRCAHGTCHAPLKDSNVCRLSKALTASSDQVTSYGNRVGADATGLDRVLQGAVRELHNHGLKPAVSKLDFHIGSRSTGMPFLFPRERAAPGVEFATLDSYQRTIELDGAFGTLTVRPDEAGTQLQVRLEIPNYERLAQMVERIRRIFDLDANPIQIPSYLSADPDLRHLVKRRLGLRVPCVWDGFEAAVHAVLGQNLTKKGAGKQVAWLVATFGKAISTSVKGLNYRFPVREMLARADLSKVGISDEHAILLRKLARAIVGKRLIFSTLQGLGQIVSQLIDICEIDDSTVNYIAMRAFGEPDAFPAGEFERRFLLKGPPLSGERVTRVTEEWRPWRA